MHPGAYSAYPGLAELDIQHPSSGRPEFVAAPPTRPARPVTSGHDPRNRPGAAQGCPSGGTDTRSTAVRSRARSGLRHLREHRGLPSLSGCRVPSPYGISLRHPACRTRVRYAATRPCALGRDPPPTAALRGRGRGVVVDRLPLWSTIDSRPPWAPGLQVLEHAPQVHPADADGPEVGVSEDVPSRRVADATAPMGDRAAVAREAAHVHALLVHQVQSRRRTAACGAPPTRRFRRLITWHSSPMTPAGGGQACPARSGCPDGSQGPRVKGRPPSAARAPRPGERSDRTLDAGEGVG
jgi:hypothetical protein